MWRMWRMWRVWKISGSVLTGIITGTTTTVMTVHSNMANKKYVTDGNSCRFNFISKNGKNPPSD